MVKKAEKGDKAAKTVTFQCINPTAHQLGKTNPAKGNLRAVTALDGVYF